MGTLPWRTVQLAFVLVPVVLFALIVVRPRLLRALVAAQQHAGTGKQH